MFEDDFSRPRIEKIIEAMIFCSPAGLSLEDCAEVAGDGAGRVLEAIQHHHASSPIHLSRRADGRFVFEPRVKMAPDVIERPRRSLSPAAIKTLGFVALYEPVTVADVDRRRQIGEGSKTLWKNLLDSGLVAEGERLDNAGRAKTYETTNLFLEVMGLASINDFPTEEEIVALDLLDEGGDERQP